MYPEFEAGKVKRQGQMVEEHFALGRNTDFVLHCKILTCRMAWSDLHFSKFMLFFLVVWKMIQ
jgi:hypothetical protein